MNYSRNFENLTSSETVRQARIKASGIQLNGLRDQFLTQQSTVKAYADFTIAGFCFIPTVTNPSSGGYETSALRVYLALYRIGTNNLPEIKLYSSANGGQLYNSIDDAVQDTTTSPFLNFLNDVSIDGTAGYNVINDPLYVNAIEFELVFLDINTYTYLTTEINADALAIGLDVSLLVERAVVAVHPAISGATQIQYYRTLLFTPCPEITLPNYTSRGAVAYAYGQHCPPLWEKKTLALQSRKEGIITRAVDQNEQSQSATAPAELTLQFLVQKTALELEARKELEQKCKRSFWKMLMEHFRNFWKGLFRGK
ncbi:MAG: hypothetical protein AAGD05_07010 [Bacteroidota bacterium]